MSLLLGKEVYRKDDQDWVKLEVKSDEETYGIASPFSSSFELEEALDNFLEDVVKPFLLDEGKPEQFLIEEGKEYPTFIGVFDLPETKTVWQIMKESKEKLELEQQSIGETEIDHYKDSFF